MALRRSTQGYTLEVGKGRGRGEGERPIAPPHGRPAPRRQARSPPPHAPLQCSLSSQAQQSPAPRPRPPYDRLHVIVFLHGAPNEHLPLSMSTIGKGVYRQMGFYFHFGEYLSHSKFKSSKAQAPKHAAHTGGGGARRQAGAAPAAAPETATPERPQSARAPAAVAFSHSATGCPPDGVAGIAVFNAVRYDANGPPGFAHKRCAVRRRDASQSLLSFFCERAKRKAEQAKP